MAKRTPLNRERVLRAAVALADDAGIESLSMRRLGQELGVEAMSLYNHVSNKDDILAGILDLVVGEIDLRAEDTEWKATMRRIALSAHEVLRRHPWAPSLLVTRPEMTGAARWRQMDTMLGTLRAAGFSLEQTHHAFHVLDSYIKRLLSGSRFLLPVHDKPAKIEHGQVVARLDMAVPGPIVQSLPSRNWFAA